MAGLKYDKIVKCRAIVQCNGPLRIGSAVGSKEEVLIHPVDNQPFVQASSIAGVLKSYYKSLPGVNEEKAAKLFGSPEQEKGTQNKGFTESRIKVSDGVFLKDENTALKLELRPHVKITRETGSADAVKMKGTDIKAGQKFNMEYIGKGSAFAFELELYEMAADHLEAEVDRILAGLRDEAIQFGGKKSSGAGSVKLVELKCRSFDLKKTEERKAWIAEDDSCAYEDYLDKLPKSENTALAYRVTVKGRTEGGIQVKGIAVSEFGQNAPNSENIRNAMGECIVPGSSFKGSVRSQMEKIAEYIGKTSVIEKTFGTSETAKGKSGNIVFYDTVITDPDENGKEKNDNRRIIRRIHVDKLTGGVFNKGFFNEKNVAGNVEFVMDIRDKNDPDATLGLLLLAMRDLAIGMMSVGNGYSTGKGLIQVEKICIENADGSKTAELCFKNGQEVKDSQNIVSSALGSLKGVKSK